MRAKLLKINTQVEHMTWNYGDDYSDVVRHVVSEHSPWEEVTPQELTDLKYFIEAQNTQYKNMNRDRKNSYYLLVTDEQELTCEKAIKAMREDAAENERRLKLELEARKRQEAARKADAAVRKKARLEKQLLKLQNELQRQQQTI